MINKMAACSAFMIYINLAMMNFVLVKLFKKEQLIS